jgi:hypothetical protein
MRFENAIGLLKNERPDFFKQFSGHPERLKIISKISSMETGPLSTGGFLFYKNPFDDFA